VIRKPRIGLLILGAALWCSVVPVRGQMPGEGQTPMAAPSAPPLGSTTAIATEAAGWLADLVKINTTNPPGNEDAAAKYVAGALQKEGIPAEILPVMAGRSAVVARLQSSAVPNPARALLLVAHMDVVGVDRAKWTVDPFGAVQKNGYLYGRGSLDDKGMLAANMAVMVALKRAGVRLNRDVIFLATDDEEQGGDASIRALIAKYWEKFAAGFSLNEGGNVFLRDGKVQYVGVQASEKVAMNVTVIAEGTSGHASIPVSDNAVVHLAAAIEKIGNYSAPVHYTTIVQRYFEALAPLEPDDIGKWIRSLDSSDRGEHAARVISDANPMWNAMIRDTVVPTMLSAGVRANVIPGEARANLNVRLLPGDTITTLLADLTKLVNDPKVRFELQPDAGLAAPPSSLDSELYATITKATAEEFNGAPVLPIQSTWATDSAQLRLHNVAAYGLWPFPLTEDDLERVHGNDERIPLASFTKGVDYLARIVGEFAVAK